MPLWTTSATLCCAMAPQRSGEPCLELGQHTQVHVTHAACPTSANAVTATIGLHAAAVGRCALSIITDATVLTSWRDAGTQGHRQHSSQSYTRSIASDDGSGSAEVTAHFGPGDDPAHAVTAAAQAAGLTATPEHTTELVPPQTWTQTIEDSYQPLCVVQAGQQPAGVAFFTFCCAATVWRLATAEITVDGKSHGWM